MFWNLGVMSSLPFLFLSLPPPSSSLPIPSSPPKDYRSSSHTSLPCPSIKRGTLGERSYLPQLVWAEPGRQTIFLDFQQKSRHSGHLKNKNFCYLRWSVRHTVHVSCNAVNCYATIGTRCTAIRRQQMELNGYSWPTCSKQPRCIYIEQVSSTTSTFSMFCWQHLQFAMVKFFKCRIWDKVLEGSTLIFKDTQISL